MDYEKKYKEALERVKQIVPDGHLFPETAEEYFPELAKSEDEKIRKELIVLLNDLWEERQGLMRDREDYEKYLAWLEKQKEYESTDFDYVWEITDCGDLTAALDKYSEDAIKKMCHAWYDKGIELERKSWLRKQKSTDVLDAEEREFADDVDSYRKDMDEFYQKGYDAGREAERQDWLEKQKPVDKPEPKFKVGDWTTASDTNLIRKIIKVENGYYTTDYGILPIEDYDSVFRLWSIYDLKDGDVIAMLYKSNNYIVIFKNLHEKNFEHMMSVYCFYNKEQDTYCDETDSFHVINSGETIAPATKEQRDLLFQKMCEAGYTWDADKKELKKIEQKPIMEEINGEDYGIDSLWHAQRILEKTLGEVNGYQSDDGILDHKAAITAVKKLREQEPAEWSEEDKAKIEVAAYRLSSHGFTEDADWLKSLRPQKQNYNETVIPSREFILNVWELGNSWKELTGGSISTEHGTQLEYIQKHWSEGGYFDKLRPQKIAGYNPYKAVVDSIAKMCDKYTFTDEIAGDFLNDVRAKCREAKEYDAKYGQEQWKPTEEQIKAFEHFIRSLGESGYASPYDNNTKLLYSLLEQLKQL